LSYSGRLPAQRSGGGGGRAADKHTIRKCFHKQLRELWKQHPDLRYQSERLFLVAGEREEGHLVAYPAPGNPNAKTWVEHIADNHQRCNGRFVPLVSKEGGFTCSLNILFLRRDNPDNHVESGGNIDNRIKVLLDGLKMPQVVQDLGGIPLDVSENPFFCLLEDDSLITSLSVETDRLLTPMDVQDRVHDVSLLVQVKISNPSALFAGDRLV